MTRTDSAGGSDGDAGDALKLDELRRRLEQFRLLYGSDAAAADRMLNDLGGQGKVEREMLGELATADPWPDLNGSPRRTPSPCTLSRYWPETGRDRPASCGLGRSHPPLGSWCNR